MYAHGCHGIKGIFGKNRVNSSLAAALLTQERKLFFSSSLRRGWGQEPVDYRRRPVTVLYVVLSRITGMDLKSAIPFGVP
jgi:hypothetical protein